MTDALETRTTVTLTVNGREVTATKGEMLISAADRVGTYIPRFCYHPRMEPVGVCRMCLVEVDGPRGATLQPACYIQVGEGMVVNTESEKVKKAQDGVLEFLLANHPLDCPVCDKGGECPLQDQTLAHGSGETRFIEEKRHFPKPIEIGELVLLDRERCIQCSRCTRFASEVAGDAQIDFAGRGDNIEVAPSPTEPFDSIFSGNTVQICPVGALTAKPYRFTARPWDLEQVESTCTTCAVGCRVAVQSSSNRLTRVLGMDSEAVNHGWLCDKGRFAIDSVVGIDEAPLTDSARRITEPMIRRNGALETATWGEALREAARIISSASTPSAVGAIGGAALTNEGAFAWQRFFRGVVGTDSIDAQYGDGLDPVLVAALPRATINEAAEACTVVLLTGDLREELPVLFLRLREGLVKGTTNVVEMSASGSALSSLSRVKLPIRPGEAHLVARAITTDDAPLTTLASHPHGGLFTSADLMEARRLIGEDGSGVVFVVGRPNLAESSAPIEAAIRIFAERFPQAKFLPTLRRGNVNGALDMGLTPNLAPGQQFALTAGRSTLEQLRAASTGEQSVIVSLGGDILENVVDTALATAALTVASLIAVTGHGGPSLAFADVVLPATVMHERLGTVTNIEGRVSLLAPKVTPPGSTWPDVAIASELAEEFGQNLGLSDPEETANVIEATTGYPCGSAMRSTMEGIVVGRIDAQTERRPLDPMAFPGIRSADLVGIAPRAGAIASSDATVAGIATRPTLSNVVGELNPVIPMPDTYSLRLVVDRTIYDNGAAVRGTEALRALVPTSVLRVNPHDLTRIGVTSGGAVRLTSARGSEVIAVVTDVAVPRGCVALRLGTLATTESSDSANVVNWIVDSEQVVVEVRMDSL
ncbi:MAG: NADH-quinone oxidoreductase subunit NuoG [Actinobacteria bacterium]|nr:NADH-quinone oxidoreductase subunit NuoG [Actinomycetota bacterium]